MSLALDLRYALRGLRRQPAFAASAVLTLALGIGANSAMFGLVDRLLLSAPPHIAQPERVVRFDLQVGDEDGARYTMSTTSYPAFADVRDHTRSFTAVAAVSGRQMVYGRGASATAVASAQVSGSYFALLGVRPALGRFFGEDDDRPPSGSAVAVLSHAFWKRELAGDRAVLGREIVLDRATYTVIGVAPPDFTGDHVEPIALWVPLNAGITTLGPNWRSTRGLNVVALLGRLRDGVAAALAADDATLALRRGMEGQRDDGSATRVRLASLLPARGGERASTQARIALWLAGVSAIVFLIAVANVTNLLLLRAVRRRREIAVRLAIGAGRRRLIQQLTVESLLLAATGGVLALFLASWGGEAVRILLMPGMAAAERIVQPRVLAITALGTIIAGLFAGLVPALRASRPSLVADLTSGGGTTPDHRAGLRTALLLAQSALSVVLLVGAGLFVTSLHKVQAQDLGFSAEHVLLATMKFAGSSTPATQDALYAQAAERVARLAGVEATTLAQAVPFEGHNVPPIAVPGRADFPDPRQQAPFLNAATPTYFRVLGMHLRAGREFTAADREGSPLVIIVNASMARGLWPAGDALGKCVRVGTEPGKPPESLVAPATLPCREVVGIVNDARPRSIREESGQARMQYYIPFGQVPTLGFGGPSSIGEVWGLLVRTAGDPRRAAPRVQRAMQSFAADLPFTDVRPLQETLDRQIRPWRLGATMFSVFGALALVLAAVGLYGVLAYSVAQRTREMGVRMALGAPRGDVVRLVMGEGIRVVAAGLVLGGGVALAAGRFVASLLFETSTLDPMVYGTVAITLLVVAGAASAIPAWRAASVDPSVALRTD